MTNPPLQIVELRIQNVKKIKAARIRPDASGLVVVQGKNRAGKSSVLDAIAIALGGSSETCAEPVRRGSEDGTIQIDLGSLQVRRRITAEGKTTLTVSNRDGARFQSPQSLLDGLVGKKIAFDPLAFFRDPPAKQSETLRKLLGLDFSAIDDKIVDVYKKRTEIGRDIASLKAQLAAIPAPSGVALPAEPIALNDVLAEIDRATDVNTANATKRSNASAANAQVAATVAKLDAARREVARLAGILAQDQEKLRIANEAAADLQDVDLSVIRSRAREIETTNGLVRQQQQRVLFEKRIASWESMREAATNELEELDRSKEVLLAETKMPIDGLGFTPEGIRLNGVPLEQASSAEQLRVSVAIGAAMNPQLRILLLRDGSLLDAESFEAVREMATKHNMQVWIERVEDGPGDKDAIVIQDGQMKVDDSRKWIRGPEALKLASPRRPLHVLRDQHGYELAPPETLAKARLEPESDAWVYAVEDVDPNDPRLTKAWPTGPVS